MRAGSATFDFGGTHWRGPDLRTAVGGVPPAVEAADRRAGSGTFKSTDRDDTCTDLTHNPGFPSGVLGTITPSTIH